MHFWYTGSALIASLQVNRSAVAVENNSTQFLHGKLRAVSVLSATNAEEETGEETNAEKETGEEN